MDTPPASLQTHFHDRLKANENLAPYTYVKIGGPAQWLVIANHRTDLIQAVTLARKDKLPLTVLGSASNIMISDQGLPGLVVINRSQQIQAESPTDIRVDSGTLMSQLVHYTLQHKLGGIEEFLGIPGTVGGAVYNNSHHLHHLIGDYVQSVEILTHTGELATLSQAQCQFAYDESVFQR
jgi:UDP-N-acetylmuramate dehydrogenase